MLADASAYYEKGITRLLVDSFKSRKFSIGWSDYPATEGMLVGITSQDNAFSLPVMLSKR